MLLLLLASGADIVGPPPDISPSHIVTPVPFSRTASASPRDVDQAVPSIGRTVSPSRRLA